MKVYQSLATNGNERFVWVVGLYKLRPLNMNTKAWRFMWYILKNELTMQFHSDVTANLVTIFFYYNSYKGRLIITGRSRSILLSLEKLLWLRMYTLNKKSLNGPWDSLFTVLQCNTHTSWGGLRQLFTGENHSCLTMFHTATVLPTRLDSSLQYSTSLMFYINGDKEYRLCI